jgi:hypothetical protein
MKHAFITVRFDRMKNLDLLILCNDIIKTMENVDTGQLQLNVSLDRFKQMKPLIRNLEPKFRKMTQTKTMEGLRKRQDELVTAMLLHLKAIERAAFDDQMHDLLQCKDLLRKLFRKFVHQGMIKRNAEITDMEIYMETEDDFRNAVTSLGLIRYLNTISDLKVQINDKWFERSNEKKKQPLPGVTLPSKEKVISELRFLLQSIEVTVATHPENDYNKLIKLINIELTDARAQLRNLASRRITAKAKAEKKKEESSTSL